VSRSTRINLVSLLAAIGGACLLGSLWLPWYSLDTASVQRMLNAMLPLAQQQFPTLADSFNVNSAAVQTVMHEALIHLQNDMVGYRVFGAPGHVDALAFALVGVLTVWVAAQIFARRTEPSQQPGQLIGLAVLGAIRPVYGLLHQPGGTRASEFITPSTGLYVALGACVALGIAAFISMLPEPVHLAQPSTYVPPAPKPTPGSNVGEPVHGAFAPVTAYVPGGVGAAPNSAPMGPLPGGAPGTAPPRPGAPAVPYSPGMPAGPAIPGQPRGAYPHAVGRPGELPPTGPPAPYAPAGLPPAGPGMRPPAYGAQHAAPPAGRPGMPPTRGVGERGSVPPPDED
jgi:hypothetical protein